MKTEKKIDTKHMGEIWPSAQPAANPDLYGKVKFSPKGAFEVRSFQTFHLAYSAGPYGIDDTGAIRVLFRFATDWGKLQVENPTDANYVSATASNDVSLKVTYDYDALYRPRYHGLTVKIVDGYLCEGDTIMITFGDTSAGSPGLRLQSFCQSHFEFKVAVDIYATGQFIPVRNSPTISIVPSKPALWKAVAATLRRPDEKFSLGIKAEDAWGNPTDQVEQTIRLSANMTVDGLPEKIDLPRGRRAIKLKGLSVREEGILRISILDRYSAVLANANPVMIKKGPFSGYWGDLHGQSGESVGVGSAREYIEFARDLAFLDIAGHQANDFQINNAFWRHINNLTAEYNQDGKFIVFPGYEWSGNSCGFDVWLDNIASSRLHVTTNHVSGRYDLNRIGIQDIVMDAGGLKRQLRISRLPDRNDCLEIVDTVEVALKPKGDNPLWVRVTTEDGHNAWSSPIYVYREV